MKGITLIAAGIVATASGCASTTTATTAAVDPARQSSSIDDRYDTRKIAQINAIARARGVDVTWINYPQRKPSSDAPTAQPTGT